MPRLGAMRTLTDGLLLLSCLPIASAKKVVSFGFHAKTPRSVTLGHFKRDSVSAELANLKNQYHITLEIGSPPQTVAVAIDTGSADLWLMEPDNPYCEGASGSNVPSSYQVECSDGSFFDTAESSSWSENSTEFAIRYGDGTVALGFYGQDDISINDVKISGANFAVANMSNSTDGVFGIGPKYQEASVTSFASGVAVGTYDNIPMQMKQQGLISSVAYSLYLDHINEDTGTLLFGGVDHAKYKGDLGVVPVIRELVGGTTTREPSSLTVMLHGLGVQDASGNEQSLIRCSIPVLLDSGATVSRLPGYFVDAIANTTNAVYSYSLEGYILQCATAGSVEFDFSGVRVNVPIEAMMMPLYSSDDSISTDSNGNPICLLGLTAEYNNVYLNRERYILGDSVLRGLYVVYDLENWQIGIAAADLDSESEDIEEITDGIPGGSSAPSYSSTLAATSFSSASRVSVFLTELDSSITGGPTSLGGSGSQSRRASGSTQAGPSSGIRSSGGVRSSTQVGSSIRSSVTARESSDADSQGGTSGGISGGTSGGTSRGASASVSSDGAVRSTANFWLAGIFMLLL